MRWSACTQALWRSSGDWRTSIYIQLLVAARTRRRRSADKELWMPGGFLHNHGRGAGLAAVDHDFGRDACAVPPDTR